MAMSHNEVYDLQFITPVFKVLTNRITIINSFENTATAIDRLRSTMDDYVEDFEKFSALAINLGKLTGESWNAINGVIGIREIIDISHYLYVGSFTIEVQPKPYNTPKKRNKLNMAATHQVVNRKMLKQNSPYIYRNYRRRM